MEEELKRAEDDEVSYSPPLEDDFCVPPLPLHELAVVHHKSRVQQIHRLLDVGVGLGRAFPDGISPTKCPSLSGLPTLIRFRLLPPSNDLLPYSGRSNTRKDGCGGFGTSSNAFPDDFRRAKPLGSLIGI